MPELVSIPIASVEIAVEYAFPNMRLLVDRAKVVDQLFRAYKAWSIKVDDVDVISEGKPSDQGVKFKLPLKRTSFFFGAAICRLVRDDANWETAEETIQIFRAGWQTLVDVGAVEAGTYHTNISMHLQLKSRPFFELLRPFAPMSLAALEPAPVKALAAIIKWENRRLTIDGSGHLANGLFVRLERDFPGSTTIENIAHQLRADELQVFDVIGVTEEA